MEIPPVKKTNGKVITTEREQAERWLQHFKEVLNRSKRNTVLEGIQRQNDLNINFGPPSKDEITKAIKSMKSGKASGIYGIQAELLKADLTTATYVMYNLFNTIWKKEEIPGDWLKGLIVKLAKKGDLGNCDNWRGIPLLSVPSKVFCKVLLNGIDEELDNILRQEQTEFRKGKGCVDQIFTLRNIIEQSK